MALNPRAEQIYELASLWLNECLLNDGSLFWAERQVWTQENLNHFWSAFAENLDEGSGTFVEKWAQQLNGQSDDVHRMAVELTAIYCLFPADKQMGSDSKRKLLNEVLAFSGDLGEMDQSRKDIFDQAIDGGGIGLTGAGYLAARPFHMGMYLGFAKIVKASKFTSIADIDPKPTLNEAFELVSETMNYKPISTIHILLHILWPEQFEDYASESYKKNMAKNLSAHFGLTELDDIDKTILQARKHMEANGYEPNFSMYDPEIEPLWHPSEKKTPTPLKREVSTKFELAALFRERVLENNGSFLWPDEHEVWTPENARSALNAIKHLAGKSQNEADTEIQNLILNSDDSTYQILCDVRAAYVLKTPLKEWIAENQLKKFIDVRAPFDGDEDTFRALVDSASQTYPGSIWGGGGVATVDRLLIILDGVTSIISNPDTIGDRDAMVEQFFNSTTLESESVYYFPFWSLFYLMYPNQIASIPGDKLRSRALAQFSHLTKNNVYPNYMAKLADIRAQLDPDFDPYTFDFFDEPWKSMWHWDKADEEDQGGTKNLDAQPPLANTPPTITDLAATTFLDESHLRDIESLLKSKKQLIFEGPPGSGKTFVAEKFARYFTGQALTGDRNDHVENDHVELVQFHQSYSYEDFVEGIRPETIDGQLHYNVKPGIFREFANKAWADLQNNYVLIIDEINRGNVSRILGELMLLLEYRHERARLPYSQEELEIPPNLFIIGTMNSADRSLSQIDYALRRRFYFVRFLSVENGEAKVLRRWLDTQPIGSELRHRILHTFIELNAQLRSHLDTDDLQVGHSYFMNTQIGNDDFRKQVWKYAVIPLIREYLYHHRDRDELLQSYELQRLASIVQPIAEETGEPAARLINEAPGEVPE